MHAVNDLMLSSGNKNDWQPSFQSSFTRDGDDDQGRKHARSAGAAARRPPGWLCSRARDRGAG
jgi:hypothetical protein